MNELFSFCVVLVFIFTDSIAQPLIGQAEILFRNSTEHEIVLVVSPASAVFSGFYTPATENFRKYSLTRSNLSQEPFWPLRRNDTAYIVGGSKLILPGDYCVIDFDDGLYYDFENSAFKVLGGISYGLWKFEVFQDSAQLIDAFYFDERDMNHGTGLFNNPDIFFSLVRRNGSSSDSVLFIFSGAQDTVNIYDSRILNKVIKSWHKVGLYSPIYGQDPIKPGSPNLGQFRTLNRERNIPIYATDFGGMKHSNAGEIDLNLIVEHDIRTRDTLCEFPTNLVVSKGTELRINYDVVFEMITPLNSGTNFFNVLTVKDSAWLSLYPGATLIIDSPNELSLEYGSKLTLALGSNILIRNGGKFCNVGGKVLGPGHVIFDKGIHNTCEFDGFFAKDSTKIVLDSSTLYLPDNYTLYLKGNETALILNPGSKLLFGENSGIVCDSGARIVANDATFASVDSTKKWNGISLNDLASDTIKNCIIKNAMYGIMISDRYDPEESPVVSSLRMQGSTASNLHCS